MKIGIRAKLFFISVALIGICFVAADAYLTRGIKHNLTERIESDLRVRDALVARGWPILAGRTAVAEVRYESPA